MMAEQTPQGLLILPHVHIQNANAISSPMTHGFPAMTAFLGLMWALDRRLAAADIPLIPEKIGVICHHHEEQTQDGYVKSFRLTRNPVGKDGGTAAIVEEGRIHLDITLVFQVNGGNAESEDNLLFQAGSVRRREVARQIRDILDTMRVAGGSVLPVQAVPGQSVEPILMAWPSDHEEQSKVFRHLRRRWLPGFALVSRDDLLRRHVERMRAHDPNTSVLDAWLDMARFNYRSHQNEQGKVEWKHDREPGSGWIVPIPVGYAGLSPLYPGGQVRNARDGATPLRFVESVYSLGQWISPHRLRQVTDFLWWGETRQEPVLYRCRNDYVAPAPDEASSLQSGWPLSAGSV